MLASLDLILLKLCCRRGTRLASSTTCLRDSSTTFVIYGIAPGFSFAIDTVLNVPHLAELIDPADIVFHLAAAVGVRLIVENPVHTIETNLKGAEIVLNLAAKKKKRVLLTSTSEVYGKLSNPQFAEEDDPCSGAHKQSALVLCCLQDH